MQAPAHYDPKNTDAMFEEYTKRFMEFEKTIGFPLESNSIFNEEFDNKQVYRHMTETYPLCHGAVLLLAHRFLLLKRECGSKIEQKFYDKMTLTELFDRISTKRAVVFYNASDDFMLRNGRRSSRGWENVGDDNLESYDQHQMGQEFLPKLAEYLSYDELMLSALCGVSSPTHFINAGSRGNRGTVNLGVAHQPEGIYMGLIGARFEKQHVMEHSLMVVAAKQNTEDQGYGHFKGDKDRESLLDRLEKAVDDEYFLAQVKASQEASKRSKKPIFSLFESFYSRPYLPTYKEVDSNLKNEDQKQDAEEHQKWKDRYFASYGRSPKYLDKEMWHRRIRVSLELFLFDSDHRAKAAGKKAFCHLVGLGAGYWSFNRSFQDREMVKVVKAIVNQSVLRNIEVIYFSWFDDKSMKVDDSADADDILYEGSEDDEYLVYDKTNAEINCLFGRRNPAAKLLGDHEALMLSACFAWDSNAFPGNEYWFGRGHLSASGDPAAASCSTISFVQNPEINKEYLNGANAHFYFVDPESGKYELCKLSDIEKDFAENEQKWLEKSAKSIPYKRDKFVKKGAPQKQTKDAEEQKASDDSK